MKIKKLKFLSDILNDVHVYVVMARYWDGEWQVLFVERSKEDAFACLRRWSADSESYEEYKVVETELF